MAPRVERLADQPGVGLGVEQGEQLQDLQERRGDAPPEDRGGRGDGVTDADQAGSARPAVAGPLPAVGVAQRSAGQHVGHRRRPVRIGPCGQAGDGPAGSLEGGPVAQHLEGRVGGRPDEQHREVPALVQEDQRLVTVEVGDPGQRAGHRPRLGAGVQAVLAVDVGHAARAADRVGRAQRVDAPAGPSRRVHHQVGFDGRPVDDDPAHPALRRHDAVHVALPDGEPRHRAGHRAQRALEGVAAGPEPGGDDAHARHVEGDGLGTPLEPGGERRRPLALECAADLRAEGVRVVELHDPRAGPATLGRRGRVTVHRDDGVAPGGQRAPGEQAGRAGSDDRDSHENASSRACGASTAVRVFSCPRARQRKLSAGTRPPLRRRRP
ncbi:MAG TPA: hypothetical protein VGN47_10105 [Blastococcus sp.]|nr:hypothetical protein [Blastococcus sp.]